MRILHSKKLVYVSKPRCGSTSVRRILDGFMESGDELCDWAGQFPELHPHMTAPAIWHYLRRSGFDADDYTYFTVTRNPIEMLWSCYKFFQPDINCRYNFDKKHSSEMMDFEDWILMGRLGLGAAWKDYVPSYITEKDLTPLALETFVYDLSGRVYMDKTFKMEERVEMLSWLSGFLGKDISDIKVNMSASDQMPVVSDSIITRVKEMFPMECELYSL